MFKRAGAMLASMGLTHGQRIGTRGCMADLGLSSRILHVKDGASCGLALLFILKELANEKSKAMMLGVLNQPYSMFGHLAAFWSILGKARRGHILV